MSRKIKILAVCGFGVGTSLILRMNIEKVLQANGVNAEVINADITTAASVDADIIFTSRELYSQLQEKAKAPLVQIDNFMNLKEIEEKGVPAVKEIL